MLEIRKINPLNPFGRMCVSLGMIPSSYKESLTYEEQLLWLFNYLENTLIPKINETGERVNDLIDLFNQLKEYVDNYFENLDVQDEINHKLDEMVEDGTFDVIFAQLDEKIGDISNLTTTDKSSIVNAVNEVDGDIGDLSDLSIMVSDKSSVVSAINNIIDKFMVTMVSIPVAFEAGDFVQSGSASLPSGYTGQNSFITGFYVTDSQTTIQSYGDISDNAGFEIDFKVNTYNNTITTDLSYKSTFASATTKYVIVFIRKWNNPVF